MRTRVSGFRLMMCLLMMCLAGCTHEGDENLGLGRKQARAIDVLELEKPAELVRAASQPGAGLDQKLGPRRIEASSQLKVEPPGKPAELYDESYTLDSDGKGALHLQHDSGTQSGMEAIVSGGQLYVRPRFGKFVQRRPEGDEVDRLRVVVEGVGGDYLALLERWLLVREDGRVQVAGRPGVKLKLQAVPEPTSAPAERDPARAWRDTVKVRYVDGELTVDAASGALLAARLNTSYTFRKDGKPYAVTLSFKQTTAPPQPIEPPAVFIQAPRRTRPMLDRDELLKGL